MSFKKGKIKEKLKEEVQKEDKSDFQRRKISKTLKVHCYKKNSQKLELEPQLF